ncbi:MAG: Maf family protein [Pseudomonadota bacterium]
MIENMAIMEFRRQLVLATASEARRHLVAEAGFEFLTDAVDIDESPRAGEEIDDYVLRLARAKAEGAVPPGLDAVIVAVDTAIGLDGIIIGKPGDEIHAREMLRMFSGRAHVVVSAIALRDVAAASLDVEITRTEVRFVEMTDKVIDWYIDSGEWRGRAGAYAIQGKGAALVADVRGCFTNVIGISMPTFLRMLKSVTPSVH